MPAAESRRGVPGRKPCFRPGRCRSAVEMALILSSYSLARAVMSPRRAILPKNSSRIFWPSTAAQPGAAGVSLEFERRVDQGLGELVVTERVDVLRCSPGRGRSRRASAGTRREKMILSSSLAPAWFLLLAEMPMFEPPAKTGAGLPAVVPGSGKTPNVSSFHSRTSSCAVVVRLLLLEVTDRPVRPAGSHDRGGGGEELPRLVGVVDVDPRRAVRPRRRRARVEAFL